MYNKFACFDPIVDETYALHYQGRHTVEDVVLYKYLMVATWNTKIQIQTYTCCIGATLWIAFKDDDKAARLCWAIGVFRHIH